MSSMASGWSRTGGVGTFTGSQWAAIVICASVMLLPMRAYELPVSFGFALEPYRIVFAGIGTLVVAHLLVRPRSRRPSCVYGGEIIVFVATVVLSIGWNAANIAANGNTGLVLGNVVNLAVFVGIFVLVRILVRDLDDVYAVLGTLVLAGGVVGVAAMWERASGINVFDHLSTRVAFLEPVADREQVVRDGAVRAMASAQHPIALCVVLSCVLPIGVWLSVRERWSKSTSLFVYRLSTIAIGGGIAASGSRTGVLTLMAIAIVLLITRPRLLVRKVVPTLLAVVVAIELLIVPGAVSGTLYDLMPEGGLVSEQTGQPGTSGGGRLGDLASVSEQARDHPIAGTGFGSRVFTANQVNALILDNEYFGRLVEQGVFGLAAFVLLVAAPVFRSVSRARRQLDGLADLHLALACAFGAFAAALAVFDGFSFFQATITFFVLLAVSAAIIDIGSGRRDDMLSVVEVSASERVRNRHLNHWRGTWHQGDSIIARD